VKWLRGWAAYGALVAFAAAVALATSQSRGSDSKVPSVDNPGPMGAKALRLYLEESGLEVRALREPLTQLPEGLKTVVVAAPAARTVTEAEVRALESFVRAGGTLVYLSARDRPQRHLDEWLRLSKGPRLAASDLSLNSLDDAGGATAKVTLPSGVMGGLAALRLSADTTVALADQGAVPAADSALWALPLGEGQVWVAGGADLIENRRLELDDNLAFWQHLAARGGLAFDEFHHREGAPPSNSLALVAFALQTLAFTAVFALARGTRLGPARPVPAERHRGSLEYLDSLAHLTRGAHVERELIAELPGRLRLLMQERLGVPVTLAEHEAALELERRCRVSAPLTEALLTELRAAAQGEVSPKLYARLARAVAHVERVITGRAR
jgi:hypothetical protein